MKYRGYKNALDDPNSNVEKHLRDAMNVMEELWTHHFEEVLDGYTFRNITEKCIDSTESMLNIFKPSELSELVVLLDATGKIGAGVLQGNVHLDGAFDECFEHNFTAFCSASSILISALPPGAQLPWSMSMCVPKYCTATDIAIIVNSTGKLEVDQAKVVCTNTKHPPIDAGAVIMLVICAIFIVLVLIGTIVDKVIESVQALSKGEYTVVTPINETDEKDATEKEPLLRRASRLEVKDPKKKLKPWDFITAFSLFQTVPTLLATKQAPSVITSLNGIRVISMFWVILGHTHLIAFGSGIDNVAAIKDVASRFSFQAVLNAYFSVDSFFFLSGTLLAYLTFRQMKKNNNRFPLFQFYIHRYLRLTPTYAFVLFFSWSLTKYLVAGPPTPLTTSIVGNCPKYWWTNFIYINNFYPWKMFESCLPWAWYLANDMQFYVISPIFLLPLYFLSPIGFGLIAGVLVVGFTVTATLVGVFNFQASTFASLAYQYIENPNITSNDLLYTKPWSRIFPYLVGILLGYILYRGIRLPFKRFINIIIYSVMWVIAGVIMILSLYGLVFIWQGHIPTRGENVMYMTFSRFAWGIALALIVFACHNGYGWFINSFLSMKIWTPLSRMTFNAYLVHPIVLGVIFGSLQKTIHYGDVTMAVFTVACVVISYGVAGVICLFVELPLGSVEMLMFKLAGVRGRESQRQKKVVEE